HRFLDHDFALGPLEHPPADGGILALGVLAHHHEVDVARTAVGERARHPGHQAARPQVHVLVEAAAPLDERAPERNVVGNARRPADGAEIYGRVRAHALEPILGHHPPVLEVVVAAPRQLVPVEFDTEAAADGFEHALALGHDFLADAIAGNDGDAITLGHGGTASCRGSTMVM